MLLALAACGGGFTPSFAGSWIGALKTTGKCTDGSSTNGTRDVRWVLGVEQSTITVAPEGGTCGSLLADIVGTTNANVRHKSCPPSGGFTFNFTGGTLIVTDADKLAVSVSQAGGNAAVQCDATTSGLLGRE